MDTVSPMRNPRMKRDGGTHRGGTSVTTESQSVDTIHHFNLSMTEISMADDDSTEAGNETPSQLKTHRELADSVARRLSIKSGASELSRSSAMLSELEMRSKGTMKARPCYSEIKGYVVPEVSASPQQSPVRRFSVDNGQIVAGNLVESLLGNASIVLDSNSREEENSNFPDESSVLSSGTDRYLKPIENKVSCYQSPIRSLKKPSVSEGCLSEQVPKSPATPSKRCSLASSQLLQSLKDTYSPRNSPRVLSAKSVITPTSDRNKSERKQEAAANISSLGTAPPKRTSSFENNGKGCLPALSPGLSSPTKTRNSGPDILLPTLEFDNRELPGGADGAGDEPRKQMQSKTGGRIRRDRRRSMETKTSDRDTSHYRGCRRQSMSHLSPAPQGEAERVKPQAEEDKEQRRQTLTHIENTKQGDPRENTAKQSDDTVRTETGTGQGHVPTPPPVLPSQDWKHETRHPASQFFGLGTKGIDTMADERKTQGRSKPKQGSRSRRHQRRSTVGASASNAPDRNGYSTGSAEPKAEERSDFSPSPTKQRRQTLTHIDHTAIYPEKEDLREYIAKQIGDTARAASNESSKPKKQPSSSKIKPGHSKAA